MNIEVKNLEKSQVELKVKMPYADLKPFIEKAAQKISQNLKVDGFRSGKIPFEIVKQKIGEMALMEEAARLAINATLSETIKNNIKEDSIGQPQIEITKLAPENALEYKIILALLPEITLGAYKELGIKKDKVEVEEKEIEKALSEIMEMRVKEILSDQAIKENDKALIDIQMFLDNVPLEGGQSQGAAIIIGKDYVIPGFDKNLIGLKKGDTKEFKLPYPKDHHMKNIAGKMVEFKVTVKEIYERQIPELNDETAQGFGLKNLAELKESIKKSIMDQKEKNADQKAERAMLEKILEKSKFGDLADTLVKYEGEKMLSELEQTVSEQGGKFSDYLQSINKTEDQLMLDLLPEAVKRVKTSLLLKEIAKTEKIKIKEDEILKQISEMKNYYKSAQEKDPRAKDALKYADTPEYKAYVYNVLASRQILDKLKKWNIAKI